MAAGCLPSMKNKAPSPQEKGFLQPPIGKSEHMLALSTPVGPSNAMLCTNSTWGRKFSMMAPGTWASANPLPSFHLGSVIFWDELSAPRGSCMFPSAGKGLLSHLCFPGLSSEWPDTPACICSFFLPYEWDVLSIEYIRGKWGRGEGIRQGWIAEIALFSHCLLTPRSSFGQVLGQERLSWGSDWGCIYHNSAFPDTGRESTQLWPVHVE